MKKTTIKKVQRIATRLQVIIEEIESITATEQSILNNMEPRSKILGNKGDKMEASINNLDIARIQVVCAIEDLCKSTE